MKKMYEREHWFECCDMLYPTIKNFFLSNKKFLFAYADSILEYGGEFFEEEPPEDIFITSYERGDKYTALFERDFSKKIDLTDMSSLENALILIDEAIYTKKGLNF